MMHTSNQGRGSLVVCPARKASPPTYLPTYPILPHALTSHLLVPRAPNQIKDEMPGHNAALVVLGTFLLWFGWYGFNPGSTLVIHTYEFVAAKTATTTTLAAAAGAITNLAIHKHITGVLNLEETCNGALAGTSP